VANFLAWEKNVQGRLRELRTSLVRQPVASVPELPIIDMDTQLNEALNDLSAPQFIAYL
jgi:hypothetical protein